MRYRTSYAEYGEPHTSTFKVVFRFEIRFWAVPTGVIDVEPGEFIVSIGDYKFYPKKRNKRKETLRAKELFDEYIKSNSRFWKNAKFLRVERVHVLWCELPLEELD